MVFRWRLTVPSCFRLNTSSHSETASQRRQVSREGEGSVCVADCPSHLPACVLSQAAVVLIPPLSCVECDKGGSNTKVPFSGPLWIRTVLSRLRTIRDLATLLRILLAHPPEYFTNKSAIQPLHMPLLRGGIDLARPDRKNLTVMVVPFSLMCHWGQDYVPWQLAFECDVNHPDFHTVLGVVQARITSRNS